MQREFDAIVIGSGAFGSSTAYHLARLGRRVALLERHEIGSQTSPRAAGLAAQLRGTEALSRLGIVSAKRLECFTAETGEPMVVHRSGGLKIARDAASAEHLEAERARGERAGVASQFISPEEARRLSPYLRTEGIVTILSIPSELYLEPGQIPTGYARAAAKLGATLLPHTPVTGVLAPGGRIEGVRTPTGEVRAPVVVDAAGAWARLVGEWVPTRVPVVPTRHQVAISTPLPGVDDAQPSLRFVDVAVYVRPDGGGLMIGGYEEDPVQYDMRALPPDFHVKDLPLDLGVLRRLADKIAAQLPILRNFEPRVHRGGLPTMSVDGQPIIGPIPGLEGFFVASGCCVGGLSISPAVGDVLATWIVAGRPHLDMAPFRIDRFGPEIASDAWLAERAREQYAHWYTAQVVR